MASINIVCPQCETTFALPEDLYRPGKKARCSQCGTVFPMPADLAPGEESMEFGYGETAPPLPQPKAGFFKRHAKLLLALGAVLLVLLLAYGGYLIFRSLSSSPGSAPEAQVEAPGEVQTESPAEAERRRLIEGLSLDSTRHFFVENKYLGRVLVIQGEVINISDSNKDYIIVAAMLLDEQQRVLVEKFQYCGVPLTLFQLQNLSEKELEEALENRLDIFTNNTNTPPGGRVPFVVIFPNPPERMRSFEVRVADVSESPKE